ncbi:hypothetical protein EDB83DRAFT_2309806 [Lactarius deliciosus]|nr:hypothetical protein EDB83DRAFT_2309806 [Lactarius deliciosus]
MESSDRPQSQNPTAPLGQTTVEGRTFLTSRLPHSLDPITHPSPTLPPPLTPPSAVEGCWAKPPARQETISHGLMVPDSKRQPRAMNTDHPTDEPAATTPSTIGDPSWSEKNITTLLSAPPFDRTRSVKIVVSTPTTPSPPTNTGDGIPEVKPQNSIKVLTPRRKVLLFTSPCRHATFAALPLAPNRNLSCGTAITNRSFEVAHSDGKTDGPALPSKSLLRKYLQRGFI